MDFNKIEIEIFSFNKTRLIFWFLLKIITVASFILIGINQKLKKKKTC